MFWLLLRGQVYGEEDGDPDVWVDGEDPATANWMRWVNCGLTKKANNVTAFQHEGAVYYRVHADIKVGSVDSLTFIFK